MYSFIFKFYFKRVPGPSNEIKIIFFILKFETIKLNFTIIMFTITDIFKKQNDKNVSEDFWNDMF